MSLEDDIKAGFLMVIGLAFVAGVLAVALIWLLTIIL